MPKKSVFIFPVMIIGIIAAFIIVVSGLKQYSQQLNMLIFNKKMVVSQKDQIEVALRFGLLISFYLFIVSVSVMTLRIFSGASSPASGNDPLSISTLNRIISNTIEQSIIFIGLYLPLFLNKQTKIGSQKILALASLFIVGRVIFAIGYMLGSLTKISSFRSFGFAINLMVNALLITHYFGTNIFLHVDQSSQFIYGKNTK